MAFQPDPPQDLLEFCQDPHRVRRLSASQRSALLHFLLRWTHLNTLQRCLDTLITLYPALVSLLDLYVQMLLAGGRPEQARPLMKKRLDIKSSSSAQALLARVHLACRELTAAYELADDLVQERPDSAMVWNLLGEIELARGQRENALADYRRSGELRPGNQGAMLGMLAWYEDQSDLVSANAYAVEVLESGTDQRPLSVSVLQRLREYFRRSGDTIHLMELDERLSALYQAELTDMRARVGVSRNETPVPGEVAGRAEPQLRAGVPARSSPITISEGERIHIEHAVRRTFGFESMLPGQLETIACVLRGEDALAILPTGGGKSLCYQLPAFLDSSGVTLVISPLIALMKDQVDSLPPGLRGKAVTINSSLDGDELRWRQEQLAEGAYRLAYAAPERLRQPPFLHALRSAGVSRLVIDEAHCVSAWGHDFRPDYLTIAQTREVLGSPPVLAMTATAPTQIRQDILRHIYAAGEDREKRVHVIIGDAVRPNLHLQVFNASNVNDKLRYLVSFCRSETGSGIVYAGTRARCEEIAAMLRRYGVEAEHYHAGIQDRAAVQDAFMDGRVRVVVATVAFGLGIDKPDIRFIVHYAPPPSVETYYQEAGRAGRDGEPARCLLMWSSADRSTLTRRQKLDTISVDFLRQVYATIKRRLGTADWGHIAIGDIERDVMANDTRVRVAISLLEEVDLIRRGPDLPRSASICINSAVPETALPEPLLAIYRHSHLRPDQWLDVDLSEAARQAGVPPSEIETSILQWADRGLIGYRPAGRDLLLELPPAPHRVADQINTMLERYATIQASRADDILAYAKTRRCRHGYISTYLGSRRLDRCSSCDNCVEAAAPDDSDLPDERQQLTLVLECLAASQWGWGRSTLTSILRGEGQTPRYRRSLHPAALSNPQFGALAFCSRTAIAQMLDALRTTGLLAARSIGNGGEVLELTELGRRALRDHSVLDTTVQTETAPRTPAPGPESQGDATANETLLNALRSWRSHEARSQKVPPYVVLHDSQLRDLAVVRPTTREALAKVKGFGPKRLERYGAAVIRLVQQHTEADIGTPRGESAISGSCRDRLPLSSDTELDGPDTGHG